MINLRWYKAGNSEFTEFYVSYFAFDDNFQSDSIFEPREADTGDMSATDREIEQFKQFCLDSK